MIETCGDENENVFDYHIMHLRRWHTFLSIRENHWHEHDHKRDDVTSIRRWNFVACESCPIFLLAQ